MGEWFTYEYIDKNVQNNPSSLRFRIEGRKEIENKIIELGESGVINSFTASCLSRACNFLHDLVSEGTGSRIYFVGKTANNRSYLNFVADVDTSLNITHERYFNRPYIRGGAETAYIGGPYTDSQLPQLIEP